MEEPLPITADLDYSLLGDEHVRRYEETDGEIGYIWNRAPTLVLTTRGAKSGEPRKSPLIYGTDGDRYVLVASVGGAPKHPGWYHNLVADPRAHVQIKGDHFDVTARVTTGDERDRLWQLMNTIWPRYEIYQSHTTRVIPVVVLEKV
jgi:deazaflavin-dependent oxidoreductase (nitroreductase family)